MKTKLGNYIKEYSLRNKSDESIPVYSVTNKQGFCRDYFGKDIASKDKTTYKIVPYGCFAYNPSRINVGSVDWQKKEERVIVSPLYNVFSVSEELDRQYLFYYLKSDFVLQRINAVATGSVRNNLKLSMLCEFPIRVPSIKEQKIIVERLDKVRRIIAQQEKLFSSLELLVKSRFVEMFGEMVLNPNGWDVIKLGEVCDVRDGTHDSPKYYSEGYPLVTSKNISRGKVDLTNCNLICEEDYQKINQRSKVDFGDVIMPMIGTVGNPVIVEIEQKFAIKNVALIKFYHNSKVLNTFVKALLESDYFDNVVISKVRGGTQKFISLGDIRNLEICLPPIDVQARFEDYVAQIDKLKVEVKKSLDKTQLLFDSLMQEYFG